MMCMIVLTDKASKFPQSIIFRILVFSCHKMTLITKITRMPLVEVCVACHTYLESYDTQLSFGLSGNHFSASYEVSEFFWQNGLNFLQHLRPCHIQCLWKGSFLATWPSNSNRSVHNVQVWERWWNSGPSTPHPQQPQGRGALTLAGYSCVRLERVA